ncbi:MAG: ClpXP protease specificity-enhancing factor SspB [Dehalococcoidia bacterium]
MTTNLLLDPQRLVEKQSCLHELLRTHQSVFVNIDTRRPGVLLPPPLLDRPRVALQLGLNLPTPIPDLHINEIGWRATLSFGGVPARCIVPWKAVYLIAGDGSGYGGFWPADCPPEVRQAAGITRTDLPPQTAIPIAPQVLTDPEPAPERRRQLPPGWAVIDGDKKD